MEREIKFGIWIGESHWAADNFERDKWNSVMGDRENVSVTTQRLHEIYLEESKEPHNTQTAEDIDTIISSIPVNQANFEHIAVNGTINGSLLVSLRQLLRNLFANKEKTYQNDWINIDDKPPPYHDLVLVRCSGGLHTVNRFVSNDFPHDCTHWMLIPPLKS